MSSRSRQWRFRLHHIIEALEKIHNYVDGMSIEGFLADSRTSDAILKSSGRRIVWDTIHSDLPPLVPLLLQLLEQEQED